MPLNECRRRSRKEYPWPARKGATPFLTAIEAGGLAVEAKGSPYECRNVNRTFYYLVEREAKSREVVCVLQDIACFLSFRCQFIGEESAFLDVKFHAWRREMFKPKGPYCQSCGMPLSKDEKGGGSEADGSKSAEFCSHCYAAGKFTEPEITATLE